MIELVGDDLTIRIKEDNPVYNLLKNLDGTSFVVSAGSLSPKTPQIKKHIATKEVVEVNREKVLSRFDKEISSRYAETDRKTLTYGILRDHLMQVLGGETGMVSMEKVEEGVYRRGELYLVGIQSRGERNP